MDHIPQIQFSSLSTAHLTIPLLDKSRKWEYPTRSQGLEYFQSFPLKHGFSTPNGTSSGDKATPPLAFLQSWLYFGLLAEAFGTNEMAFDPEHFIARGTAEGEDADAVITTKELTRYIWYWAASVAHGSRDWIDEHSANLDRCLELANTVVNALSERNSDKQHEKTGERWSTTTATLFSIITLVEYLRRARIDINIYTYEVNLPNLEWDFPPLDVALSEAGWCVAEIAKLKRETDCSTRFYLSRIDRMGQGKDHSRCTASGGCMAHQIYEPSYRTRHRPGCKGDEMCWSLGPKVEDVVNVIGDGGYPLVNLHENGREVEVCSAGEGSGDPVYVTISHVWSDGLGNPHNNTIPYCQLAYIQGLVNSLYADSNSNSESARPVKFWLDTLCIPVADEYSKYRKLAINRMNTTFRGSDKTLALDNSLMAQDTEMDWVEMNMRIKYCPWVTRAWTLLEGRVGKDLLFQFKSGAVSSNVVFDRSYAAKNIVAVSGMLEQRGAATVLHEPSALQLARALILLPREPTAGLEDDLSHIDTVHAARKAYETWKPALQAANLASDFSDIDDDMSVNIQTRVFCPVIKHSNYGTRNIRDEFWLESRAEKATQADTQFYFQGVYLAFRGRTATKAEDEAICFGQMLGTDTSQITSIPSLKPRARYWLTLLDSYYPLRMISQACGLDPHAKLTECQERRIRTLLMQIGKLPLSVLLWTAPRMQTDGWKWAPMSLLDASPGSGSQGTWASSERGTIEADGSGFTVRLPALRLKAIPKVSEVDANIDLNNPIHLDIAVKDDGFVGPGSATFRVQFSSESIPASWKRYKTWSALLQGGILSRLAILTRRRASIHDPFKNHGVLLELHETQNLEAQADLVKQVHFRGLVERPHEVLEEKLPVISVEGDWDVEGEWCVG